MLAFNTSNGTYLRNKKRKRKRKNLFRMNFNNAATITA